MKLNTAAIMRSIKRSVSSIGLIMICVVCSTTVMHGQPGDPGGGVKPGDVPITGIEILLAAGGALGIRKLIQRRKAQQ